MITPQLSKIAKFQGLGCERFEGAGDWHDLVLSDLKFADEPPRCAQ